MIRPRWDTATCHRCKYYVVADTNRVLNNILGAVCTLYRINKSLFYPMKSADCDYYDLYTMTSPSVRILGARHDDTPGYLHSRDDVAL